MGNRYDSKFLHFLIPGSLYSLSIPAQISSNAADGIMNVFLHAELQRIDHIINDVEMQVRCITSWTMYRLGDIDSLAGYPQRFRGVDIHYSGYQHYPTLPRGD